MLKKARRMLSFQSGKRGPKLGRVKTPLLPLRKGESRGGGIFGISMNFERLARRRRKRTQALSRRLGALRMMLSTRSSN